MADGKAEVTIARTPDDVWKLVGEFDRLDTWMPGVDACALEGDVRTISTMGMEIKEQLRERDERARRIAYGIVQSPMPLEHHQATITVEPDGDGSKVTWAVDVRPDEMLPAFLPIYEGSLQAVKQHLEP